MNGKSPCDLVMKGGIASGIVYPPAILKLRDKYYFQNIGGTSAGAIAASLTAAAQYGENSKKNEESFVYFKEQLEDFFVDEKNPDNLKNLFQPSKKNEWLFNFALKLMAQKEVIPFLFQHIATILWNVKVKSAFKNLKEENFYGLCTGMRSEADKQKNNTLALTEWLDDIMQKCSGLNKENKPLTFGHLEEEYNDKKINLKMVTSNLSQNQPYVLPFQDKYFIFEKSEFYRLFPKYLVDYMINELEGKQREDYENDNTNGNKKLPVIDNKNSQGKEYHFLPIGKYMPVLVATRMSLSFPFLFSMIPLYTIKTNSKNKTQISHQDLEINFFSDGGIASNFPIQFFDSIIPSSPTFGFNLTSEEKFTYLPTNISASGYKIPSEEIYLANPEDLPCPPLNNISSIGDIILKGIFPTAQNYRDTLQSELPSYRERIIQILIRSNEGGLNLDMDRRKIRGLQEKGEKAGTELLEKFNFEHHQWVRLKIMMGLLEKGFAEIDRIIQTTGFDYTTLLETQKEKENNFPYPETESEWCKESQVIIDGLIQLINNIKNESLLDGVFSQTKPLVDEKQILLRVTPEI